MPKMPNKQTAEQIIDTAPNVSADDTRVAPLSAEDRQAIVKELQRANLALITFGKALSVAQIHVDDLHFNLLVNTWENLRDPMIELGLESRFGD